MVNGRQITSSHKLFTDPLLELFREQPDDHQLNTSREDPHFGIEIIPITM